MHEKRPNRPKIDTPSIKPARNTPGFIPIKSPEVNRKAIPEVRPGVKPPEIAPKKSPDATPKKAPTEIPPHNDPYSLGKKPTLKRRSPTFHNPDRNPTKEKAPVKEPGKKEPMILKSRRPPQKKSATANLGAQTGRKLKKSSAA